MYLKVFYKGAVRAHINGKGRGQRGSTGTKMKRSEGRMMRTKDRNIGRSTSTHLNEA
jgi:hypothetical protein